MMCLQYGKEIENNSIYCYFGGVKAGIAAIAGANDPWVTCHSAVAVIRN